MYKHDIFSDGLGFKAVVTCTNEQGAIETLEKFYFTELDAHVWVNSKMKDYLLMSLRKYIHHSEILQNVSASNAYNSRTRNLAMSRLKDYLTVMGKENLRGLSLQVLNFEQDLRAILPSPTAKSYASQLEKLESMIWMCIRIRKEIKKNNNL